MDVGTALVIVAVIAIIIVLLILFSGRLPMAIPTTPTPVTPTPAPPTITIVNGSQFSVSAGIPIQWQATGFTPNSTLTISLFVLAPGASAFQEYVFVPASTVDQYGNAQGAIPLSNNYIGSDYIVAKDSFGRSAQSQFFTVTSLGSGGGQSPPGSQPPPI